MKDRPNIEAEWIGRGWAWIKVEDPFPIHFADAMCGNRKLEFPASETASVWLGDFTDDDGVDDNVKSDVEAKLQLSPEAASTVDAAHRIFALRVLPGRSDGHRKAKGDCLRVLGLDAFHLDLRDAADSWRSLRLLGSFRKEK